MPEDDKDRKDGASQNTAPENESYRVGYRRPPMETRFKPKQSGNPRGRPKHRPSLSDILAKALHKVITVRDGDRKQRVSVLEALADRAIRSAYKGDTKLLTLLLKIESTGFSEKLRDTEIKKIMKGMSVQEAAEIYRQSLRI